jgi:PAS domain S-box-containing protein
MNPYPVAELAQALFEQSSDALFLVDPETELVLDVNPAAQRLSGLERAELLRRGIANLFREALRDGPNRLQHVHDGVWVPVLLTVTRLHAEPKPLGLIAARELSEHQAAEELLAGQNRVLEQIALGRPLPVIFATLCRMIEEQSPGLRAAVHLLDGKTQTLQHGAAPSLPEEYARGLHGAPAGPASGPCGAAVDRNLPVVVHDGASDPLWEGLRELADRLDLRAGWALPVVSQSGQVLGACAAYAAHSQEPSPRHWRVLEASANLVAVAIERQRDADRIIASEQRFRALVENSNDGIAVLDEQGRILFATAAATRILGYPLGELIGRLASEFVHPDDIPIFQAPWGWDLCDAEDPFTTELRVRHQRGWWLYLEGTLSNRLANPAIRGIVANFRDVTQRRQAEGLLRDSERRYRLLFERNLAGVFRSALDGRILDCNDAFAHVFGYASRQEALAGNAHDFYFDDADRAAFLDRLNRQGTLNNIEVRMRRRDGLPVWVLENVGLLTDDEGTAVLEGTVLDITERHRAEEAVRASEAKYRTLVEHLEHSVFLKDRDLRFAAVNRPFCNSLGRSEADVLGKCDYDFYPAYLADKYRKDDLMVLHEGRQLEVEEQNLSHGVMRCVRVFKTPVKDDRGNLVGVLGIFWDVTEQRAVEAQLRHAQKMEAVGQLAGGIAHDFNNLLTVILGNTSMVLCQLPEDDPHRELLQTAEQAAQRAAELTQRLLGFSRRTVLRTEAVNLNHSVEETVRLLQRTLDPRIQVETKPADGLWTVKADAGQITQVLLNLCLNARDAMPEGGRLTLGTTNVTLDEAAARASLESRPGRYVRLSVSDTGCGIAPEIRQRIYEPFFTTKEVGKGTGLGLAMVFAIVQQHQGWVECQSTVDEGTCFHVYLPRHATEEGQGTKDKGQQEQGKPPLAGKETILLVDDEALIRNLGSRMLQSFGYTVLLAEDGLKAIDLYERRGRDIDLVILDWTMPRMSGLDALRRLAELNPAVRVVFSSGYAAETAVPAELPQVAGFLNKPYRLEELGQKVRAVLSRNLESASESGSIGGRVSRRAVGVNAR